MLSHEEPAQRKSLLEVASVAAASDALHVLDVAPQENSRHPHRTHRLHLYKNPRVTTFRPPEPQDSQLRKLLLSVIASPKFEMFGGLLIMANFAVIVFETDYRAMERSVAAGSSSAKTAGLALDIISVCNAVFSLFYSFEFICRLWAQRLDFFSSVWNVSDLVTLTLDLAGEVVERCVGNAQVADMQFLRSMRMVRLVRLSRVVVSFPELYNLVCGLARCIRTLMWAAGLILVTLTVWSIMAVEFISPLIPDLIADGNYSTCDWCGLAFESVALANLTFFQIVSGDGWSFIARPIIDKHPWTGIIFVSIIFVVMFGLLNLIIAAIVDASAQAREDDVLTLSLQTEADRQRIWDSFSKLCVELDADNSGDINKEEFKEGLKRSPLLQAYLTVMGVNTQQIEAIFELLDENGDGEVSYHELSAQLYDMKTLHMKASTYYILKYIQDTRKKVQQSAKEMTEKMAQMLETQKKQLDERMPDKSPRSVGCARNIQLDFVQLEGAQHLGLPAVVDDLERSFRDAMMRLRCCTEQCPVAAEDCPIQAASLPKVHEGASIPSDLHEGLRIDLVKAAPEKLDEEEDEVDDVPPTPTDGYEKAELCDQGRGKAVGCNGGDPGFNSNGDWVSDSDLEDPAVNPDAVEMDAAPMPSLVRQDSPRSWVQGQEVNV